MIAKSMLPKIKEVLYPKYILISLIVILIPIVFMTAGSYGMSWDTPIQDTYGGMVFHWYTTLGKDTSFLHLRDLRYYGPFVEVIISVFQAVFNHHWYVRTVLTAFFGIIGIVFIGLCGFEIKKPWVGVTASIFLVLFPRFYGTMYMDSKDIPFASTLCIVLFFTFKLVNNWNTKRYKLYSLLLGIFLGISLAIRIVSIYWYPLLVLISVLALKLNYKSIQKVPEIKKYIVCFLIILFSSLIMMTLLWPFILMDPAHNFLSSIGVMSHFPWGNTVNFNGTKILASHEPFYYSFVWLIITTPILYIAFFLLGTFFLFLNIKNQKKESYPVFIVFLSFWAPLLGIIAIHSEVYDGIRQLLFIIPPLVFLASYGLVETITYLKKKSNILVIVSIFLSAVYLINILLFMVSHFPYEYIYFNSFIGGIKGANGKFELDYFGECNKQSAIWLRDNYQKYNFKSPITVLSRSDPEQIMAFLPRNFQYTEGNPDFYITYTRFGFENSFNEYPIIYRVTRDNTTLCLIKVNNNNR